ncbi:MAG: hypothetical protein ABI477_24105 [Chryseolinea sp.]
MKKLPNISPHIFLVAIALATAWAVRGKFGHEQGAAWAGAIGGLAIILVSKRTDWYAKVLPIMLSAAFGWGIGGMISYGVVVGYGRGFEFWNVYYGLAMLFVIGALYGFTGGGMLGLALVDSEKIKVNWHQLLTEMGVFGILTYALLINQLEWIMTPPRSELWAACFGASIAMCWSIVRLEQWAVLKVALWSALGGGFGFAFGNVLQVLGSQWSVPINLWNVMEYSIGFFGGLGMAYGVFTSSWPTTTHRQGKASNWIMIFILAVIIPFMVWDQSFTTERLASFVTNGVALSWVSFVLVLSFLLLSLMAISIFWVNSKRYQPETSDYNVIRNIFILYMGVYIILSFFVTGVFVHPLEQYLYVVNIIVFLIFTPKVQFDSHETNNGYRLQGATFLFIVILLGLSAIIMINSHGELKGAKTRFGSREHHE